MILLILSVVLAGTSGVKCLILSTKDDATAVTSCKKISEIKPPRKKIKLAISNYKRIKMDGGTNDDEFELSLSDVRRRLDWLALRSLELCEDILSERGSLDSEMSEAYLNMAKSRYNMGKWSVGTSQLPSEEAEIEALFRVETSQNGNYIEYSLTSSSSNEDNLLADQSIRQRRTNANSIDGVKEDATANESRENSNRKNPLRWFGILVPHSLRQSQQGFQKCLAHLCKIASFQNELKNVCDEYKQLRERSKNEIGI